VVARISTPLPDVLWVTERKPDSEDRVPDDKNSLRRAAQHIRQVSRMMRHPRSRAIGEKVARELEDQADRLERSRKSGTGAKN
jgi:hypothetical protein